MINNDLLYYIPSGEFGKEGVLGLLKTHPEIRFVSLVGIDLAGNDTDEKVPIELFLKNYDDFFAGTAVQTDGSSVVLMNIATLNDARVDMVADASVNWYIDYNEDNLYSNGRPVGTLRIPCFLLHNGKFIDSRSILKESCAFVGQDTERNRNGTAPVHFSETTGTVLAENARQRQNCDGRSHRRTGCSRHACRNGT